MNPAEQFLNSAGNRRRFLGSSAGMAAGMVGITEAALKAGPNDRVSAGVIGMRSRGRVLARHLTALPNADVVAVCDVDANLLPKVSDDIRAAQGFSPQLVRDFRRLLDDPSINAVVIAAPDHWHALMTIMACQAGKDVYVEKPVSHNIHEGQQMQIAAARYGRIVQTGLQQRSMSHFQSAVAAVRAGRIGTVRLARAWTTHRRRVGGTRQTTRPRGVNHDLWLGPAPAQEFDSRRFHYNWRWYWDFGTGELGNWGVHMLDTARWGLNLELPQRVSATGGLYHLTDQETPDTLNVNYSYSDATILWEHRQWSTRTIEGRSAAAAFYGDRGALIVDRGGWKIYDGDDSLACDADCRDTRHMADFIECVRTRREPAATLRIGRLSSTLAHLGNIASRLGREIRFNSSAMEFGDDSEANTLLSREYRREWPLPAV